MLRAGATLHRGARASHYRGLSCCGAQAPDAQAQQLWLRGPVAPQHVGSSQTRARTRVPCTGRRTPNHCTTREAPPVIFNNSFVLIIHIKNVNSNLTVKHIYLSLLSCLHFSPIHGLLKEPSNNLFVFIFSPSFLFSTRQPD